MCGGENKQCVHAVNYTHSQFKDGPRTSLHGCTEVLGSGANNRGIVVCLLLQIAVLKFSETAQEVQMVNPLQGSVQYSN